jgi:hypothetical protein
MRSVVKVEATKSEVGVPCGNLDKETPITTRENSHQGRSIINTVNTVIWTKKDQLQQERTAIKVEV